AVDDFAKSLASLKEEFGFKGPYNASIGADKALKTIAEYRGIIKSALNQESNLKKGLAVFKMEQPPSKEITQISNDLDLLQQIWQLDQEWSTVWESWRTKPFLSLDSAEMEDSIQRYLKKIMKVGKEVKEWDVYQSLKERINQCKRTTPILMDLKNPAMRDRHWTQLMDEIGKTFVYNTDAFTMEKIFEVGLDQYAETISNLSGAATKELSIEEGLSQIEAAWKELELDIIPYKEDRGYFKIRSTDPIFELLEDNQVTLSAMKASKYFVAFEEQVDYWERTLSHIIEAIELLLQVQRQWMYLENIFIGTEDIRKQLPKESSIFDNINITYKAIMNKMVSDKNVQRATHADGLIETLQDSNTKLEKIQKSLDLYL
ncbi:Dynein heavy chain 2, axonemal, partial [Chytridiales sp. JEL 0842]